MAEHTAPCLPAFPSDMELSPQFRLAAACSWIAPASQAQLQGETVADICKAGVDWDAFLVLVNLHGIPVQALTVLRRCLGQDIPQRVHEALKARNKRTAVRSFVQAAELIRLNRLLGEHAIDMLPLKGVALSQRLYATPDVRTSCDLDVLIRPENLAAADRLLSQLGYQDTLNLGRRLTKRQQTALLAGTHNIVYSNKDNGQRLELHWKSRFWSQNDMETFWQGRNSVTLLNENLDFPDDPILFLFLCDHGSRHRWMQLKWLGDIAMMFGDSNIDTWSFVPALADRLGFTRVATQTALLVHWLYGLPLPPPIAAMVAADKGAVPLAKKAITAMLEVGKTDDLSLGSLFLGGISKTVYLRQIKPEMSLWRLTKEILKCPAEDYVALPLPDSLSWLYVPLRPVFWFWRHFGGKFFTDFRSQYRPQ